jgi:hypothetical protein
LSRLPLSKLDKALEYDILHKKILSKGASPYSHNEWIYPMEKIRGFPDKTGLITVAFSCNPILVSKIKKIPVEIHKGDKLEYLHRVLISPLK